MAKYNRKIVDEMCNLLKSDSYTISEVCRLVGIAERTYYEWQSKNADFADAIKKAKADFAKSILCECEKSLIKLIKGYDYEERKTVMIDDKSGKPKIKEQTVTKKHIAPSLGAIIHYQTNKDPETWKNKQNVEVTGKDGKDLLTNLTDDELDKKIKELERKLGKND